MMLDYDAWYAKFGAKLQEEVDAWLSKTPAGLTFPFDINVDDCVIEMYDNYVSDYKDMLCDQYKDDKLMESINGD